MMRVYRWNERRARIGSMIAAGLVGGGLMMTASNGIAAETTKNVEQRVRTALAPVMPAVAPEAPPAPAAPAAPVAAPAPHAPKAPRVPAAPLAPVAPPAPPAPVATGHASGFMTVSWMQDHDDFVDTAAIHREVEDSVREAQRDAQEAAREAQREALEAAREAQREAMASARDAAAEARAAARETVAAKRVIVTRSCPKATSIAVHSDDGGHAVVRCGDMSPAERAAMRKQLIASLEQARRSVAASLNDDWARRARAGALASIDREIARLKSER